MSESKPIYRPPKAVKRWYLAIIQFSGQPEELIERLKSDVPTIEATLKNLSDDHRVLLVSSGGQTACWLLHTAANAKHISNRILNPEGTTEIQRSNTPDTTRRGDKIAVLQLGEERCLTGFSAIESWLDKTWNAA